MTTTAETRYIKPKSASNIFNDTVGHLTRLGVSIYGSRVLAVRGRKSGEWRTTPVNPLRLPDGTRYLVAPRGNTQWVRNLRAVGDGELHIGRKAERFSATEVADDDKPATSVALNRSVLRPMCSSPVPTARRLRTHWVLPRGATRYLVPSARRSGLTGVVRHSP
ncbi:MAG TPA: nitroreductase/quinone reductase family protein, partial [Trebonia sp.]|nr:nitroreductase/quinone reductase family protein [Trebonia sp.]